MIPAGLEITTPVPVPEIATVSTSFSAKFAVTDLAAFIVTLQELEEPLQAPDQPEKEDMGDGVAVSVTTVFALKNPEQETPQSMPPGLEVTVPLPDPDLAIVN